MTFPLCPVHSNYHPADVSCCMQVLEAVLDLINSLVAADSTALNTLCLVGVLPAAFRLASPAQSRPLRRKAALFQHVCCHSSKLMLRMVVMCQARPSACASQCCCALVL